MGDPGTGMVPDLAADMVVVVAAETARAAEAEVGAGNGPATNPPHQDGQKNRNGQDGGRSA